MTNKEKYIKSVKRKLNVPDDLKTSVLEELRESFDSAKEHGESETDLIKRLGTPKEFVNDVIKNADLTDEQKKYIKHRKNIIKVIIAFIIAAVVFTGYYIYKRMSMGNVIGYANSSTNIQVIGGSENILLILLYTAFFAVIVGLLIYSVHLKRKLNRQ